MDGVRSKTDLLLEVPNHQNDQGKRKIALEGDLEDNPLPAHTNLKDDRAQAYVQGMTKEFD